MTVSASQCDSIVRGRFVVLTHDHPFLHWDLMLESHDVLKTWRLLAEPDSASVIPAEVSPDHRQHYLDYEGPVSGGRGSVSRWDAGVVEWLESTEHRSRFVLDGERLAGEFAIDDVVNGCELRRLATVD